VRIIHEHYQLQPSTPRHGEGGQSALEFALILPFFFALLFLAAEGADLLGTWLILEHASNVGARYAAVGNTLANVQTCTVSAAGGTSLTASQVEWSNDGTVGDPESVTIHGYTPYSSGLVNVLNKIAGASIPTSYTFPDITTTMRLEDASASPATTCP
jgi:hypothetical protein